MTKRVLLAGLLGTLAMFIWTAVAHMALPLGEAGVRQIDNEQPLLAAMQSALPDRGLYLFPKIPPGGDQAQYGQQIAAGPSGMLVYMPRRDFSFGKTLAIEFVTQFVQLIIVAYLLSLTRLETFTGRVVFFALAGVAAMVATNVSYWNWYAFPVAFTAGMMVTGIVGYALAGVVAAVMKIGGATYLRAKEAAAM